MSSGGRTITSIPQKVAYLIHVMNTGTGKANSEVLNGAMHVRRRSTSTARVSSGSTKGKPNGVIGPIRSIAIITGSGPGTRLTAFTQAHSDSMVIDNDRQRR